MTYRRPKAKTDFEVVRTVAAGLSVLLQMAILARVFGWR